MLNDNEINQLIIAVIESKEYQSLFKKTQVLNKRIKNETSTRFSHTNDVADTSENIIRALKNKGIQNNEKGEPLNPKLAKLIGLLHDIGHTPYGHDGEKAINNILNKQEVTEEYLKKREENLGVDYENEQAYKFNEEGTKQFEHNEHSVEVFLKICEDLGIDKSKVIDIVNGILSHSTSRVKDLPELVEQQAVRLSDKIAYINRDIQDMLNEGKVSIKEIPKDLRDFVNLTPEERINRCIEEATEEYLKTGFISGGSKELAENKKLKKEIVKEEKNIIEQTGEEIEIINKLLGTLSENEQEELFKKTGDKKILDKVLKLAKQEDINEILETYNSKGVEEIRNKEGCITKNKEKMMENYPTMEKCYRLKEATDKAIFEKDENGIARIGNDVKSTNKQINNVFEYYMKKFNEIPSTIINDYKDYTKEEQVAFYIAGLDNEELENEYKRIEEIQKENNKENNEENNEKNNETINIEGIAGIAKGRCFNDFEKATEEIKDTVRDTVRDTEQENEFSR